MISFIIPTLDEEKVIEKLLRNLREIKTFDYEIIVTDGGSTDRTVEMAKGLADKVVEYTSPDRQTIGQGRNAGAAQAKGEFLIFLDADVHIFDPDDFFKRALKHFADDPKLVGLGGFVKVFPQMETLGDKIGYGIFSNGSFYLYNNILKVGGNCGEFGIIKADVFRQLHGYHENLAAGEDHELFRRLVKIGHTYTDPKLVIYHTGRRPHKIGWMNLYARWIKDFFYVILFNRSASKEWEVIR